MPAELGVQSELHCQPIPLYG